jgi:uncharacterized membrane protein
MKRFLIVLLIVLVVTLMGCQIKHGNRIVEGKDVTTFTYAYIRLGDKDIDQGYVTQWRDYDNSDVVQVLINGKFYLTHYSCVVLVADPSQGALQYDMGLAN